MDVEEMLKKAGSVIRNHDEIMVGYLYGSFAKGGYDDKVMLILGCC